jgi:hypothetical protein
VSKWELTVNHPGLGESRSFSGSVKETVEKRAQDQMEAWNGEWRGRQLTASAQQQRDEIDSFLRDTVHIPPALWLDALKQNDDFVEPAPVAPPPLDLPSEPQQMSASLAAYAARKDWAVESVSAALSANAASGDEPATDPDGVVPTELKLALLHRKSEFPTASTETIKAKALRLFRDFQSRFETSDDTQERLEAAKAQWRSDCGTLQQRYTDDLQAYKTAFSDWEDRRDSFQQERNCYNDSLDAFPAVLSACSSDTFVPALEIALMQAPYPAICPREFEISFDKDSGVLIINQQLPVKSSLSPLKEASYSKTKRQLVEKALSAADLNKLYDQLNYQIYLFTVYAVFSLSPPDVQTIILNGWIKFVDPGKGCDAASCIMSASITREAFDEIDLTRIDPGACFKTLRGVSSPNLHDVTPIAPIANVDRSDSRFVESKEVLSTLERGTNVAAIGWEDFEHLIREIFERELSSTGGEVKVTRASRDGGVDAIAFDPDPIRGGKIVIQAKRYTNTVDLSAVRDLYGTVVNEGATKGILVTTSNFGPDAYAFASGKPITLIDGARLLHLLERHGHRGYINLAEAKKMNLAPLVRKV